MILKQNKIFFPFFIKFLAVLASLAVLSSSFLYLIFAFKPKTIASANESDFAPIINKPDFSNQNTLTESKASEENAVQSRRPKTVRPQKQSPRKEVGGLIINIKLRDVSYPMTMAELESDVADDTGSQAPSSAVKTPEPEGEKLTKTTVEDMPGENTKGQTDENQDPSEEVSDISDEINNPPKLEAETTATTTNEVIQKDFINNAGDLANQNRDNTGQTGQDVKQSADIEITNNNNATINNDNNLSGQSGGNVIVEDEAKEEQTIESGEVNILANIVNVINTSSLDSELVVVLENFNDLSANILLNHPETTQKELVAVLANEICSALLCQNFESFTLTNTNSAAVKNDIKVAGDSGNNKIIVGEDGALIRTGDVNALVNIINVVNTNLINSVWTIVLVNIFGDWQGDLIFPSELYFIDYYSPQPDGHNPTQGDKKFFLDNQNSNQAEVINQVNLDAQSGNNTIAALANNDRGGDIENSQVSTGGIKSQANVKNMVNVNVVNSRWFMGIVNTFGLWSGQVYSLPGQVAVNQTPGGLTFWAVSDSGMDTELLPKLLNPNDSLNQKAVKIVNDNQASVVNIVDIQVNSGVNEIMGEEVENSSIITGNVKVLANIINFVNSNLIMADLYLGLVNVFGDWSGNIVFGYPDLVVSQNLLGEHANAAGKQITYEISYQNIGNASMKDVFIEWHYDPSKFILDGVVEGAAFNELQKGVILFSLGNLSAGQVGSITLNLKTKEHIAEGVGFTNHARIFGNGPEQNINNNEHSLISSIVWGNKAKLSSQAKASLPKLSHGSQTLDEQVLTGGTAENVRDNSDQLLLNEPAPRAPTLAADMNVSSNEWLDPNFLIVSSLMALIYAFLAQRRKITD